MKRRAFLPLLFALLLMMGALTIGASAADAGEMQTATHINPMYADFITEDDLVKPVPVAFGSGETYDTLEEAGAYMADQMRERAATITVNVSDSSITYDELFSAAIAHTGVPDEGDYLAWHYGGYSVSWWDSCFTYTMTYYTTAAQEDAMDAAVETLLDQLNLYNASDYQKIKGVYDYLCANITYDYTSSGMLKHTAYAGLVNKTCVCQGYASLFYRLMLELDVDCRVIVGIGNGGGHAWNIVELGDKYYALDATWDAPRYKYGYYDYFMCCESNFGDHTRTALATNGDPWPYDCTSSSFYAQYPMTGGDYVEPLTQLRITAQPVGATVINGGTTQFSVGAAGSGLSYRWQYRAIGGSWKNSTLPGCTTNTLSVTATWERHGYQFRCVITDSTGDKIRSAAARLITASDLKITSQPVRVYCTAGKTAEFSVAVSGSAATYQWQYLAPGGTWKNTTLTGCKTATLSVDATTGRNGYKYRCVVDDGHGTSLTSDAATLYVTGISSQPKSVTVAEGGTAKFTVKATGSSLSYQWQYRTPGGSWKNTTLTGNKTATLSVGATAGRDGYQYRCKVTDSVTGAIYSNGATLDVLQALRITAQPQDTAVELDATAKFTVKANGEELTYQWQYRAPGGSWKNTTLSGCKTDTLSVSATAGRDGYQYRCKVTDGEGESLTSSGATLSVIQAPANPVVTLTVKASNGKPQLKWAAVKGADKYEIWRAVGQNSGYSKIYTTTGTSFTNTSAEAGTTYYYKVRAVGEGGKSGFSAVKYITCDCAQPVVSVKLNANDKPKLSWEKVDGATKYEVWRAVGKNSGYSKIYTLTSTSFTNSSAQEGTTYYYKVRAVCGTTTAGNSAFSAAKSVTVPVQLAITAQPGDAGVELGATAKFTVKAVGEDLSYQWQYCTATGTKWSNTTLTGNKTATLSVGATAGRDGYKYRCVITDASGDSVTSEYGTLSVE